MKTETIRSRSLSSAAALFIIFISLAGCSKDNSSDNNTNTPGTPASNEVLIQGMSYNPSSITVVAGTKITWRNKDNVSHTVTSDSNLFDSGMMGTNGTFSYTFTTPGMYPYHCTVHAGMTATVIVQ
jgi:plastocyanin